MVGRADSNGTIFRALDAIAEGPIGNISIDLIAGLPGTSPGQIVSDLTEIFSRMTPKHVSIYMLEDESYPASWKPCLPDEETIRSEYRSGMEWLQARGFHRYELSNFALPGFESKHNRSYWNHSDYQGF
jgi:oxygen-independent coproporphyrinogen-3 oxidase